MKKYLETGPVVLFALACWMASFALHSIYMGFVSAAHMAKVNPFFLLQHEDGTLASQKYMTRPLLTYGMHIVPSIVWAFLAPLQFSTHFRRQYPHIHRWAGRLFFLISASLSVSGISFTLYHLSYTLPSTHWTFPFILDTQVLLLFAGFTPSGLLAFYHAAISHNIGLHRRWIVRHVAWGHGVAIMRMVFTVMGVVLEAQGHPRLNDVEFRKIMFGVSAFVAFVSCGVIAEVILAYQSSSSQPVSEAKRKQ
eukprot:TRINITY_DN5275_c0_g1_i1.p1 TRINITY_DN5275_c0_g1~~TRINITY_DN5275_c0_g1_i1.p1  ORF type:complete len:251 (-),score=40.57 TRINITY_DN5275_c0_g1_i1:244-996(-)